MKPRPAILSLALVLATGLLACQDQDTMGPEGLSPLFGVDCEKKPNHPQCVDTPPAGDVASVLFTSGFNPAENGWTWMEWDNGNAPGSILDLYSENPFETDLDLSDDWIASAADPSNGFYGPCIYEPADTDPDIVKALAEQLDGVLVPPDTPEEENIRNTRINVDLGALPGTSIDNFVRFLYLSPHPDLMVYSNRGKNKGWVKGDVGFQVGGYWNTSGDPWVTVDVDEVTGEQTFTFTGGTVSVARRGGVEPRLQCPLLDDVVVKIRMN